MPKSPDSSIIPEFNDFSKIITRIFNYVADETSGHVATYIPQLSVVNPDLYGCSLLTVDGNSLHLGNYQELFSIQSISKPINYLITLEEHGESYVHQFVGREPSGRGFNELQLNYDGLPHNPMINAGAIMCCSLIKQKLSLSNRFDHIKMIWEKLSGGKHISFDNAVYLSEKETGNRNYALAYFMNEKKKFPPGTDLMSILELYFGCCCIEMNCESLAVVAATLANGGVCPLTKERIFSAENVKNCLSLMHSCGMYDFSGEFAFMVGLPAKSGVSGGIIVVVPGKMGIALYSPRVDSMGNSVRGVEFCKQLVNIFNLHPYDCIVKPSIKIDPSEHHLEAWMKKTIFKSDALEERKAKQKSIEKKRSNTR